MLRPLNADQAVLAGAVRYGIDPAISSRKSKRCWGIRVSTVYNPAIHKLEDEVTFTADGVLRVDNVYREFLKKGESVGVDEVREGTFHPVNKDQETIQSEVWVAKTNNETRTVAGPDMYKLHSFSVPIGKTKRSARVFMQFVRCALSTTL